MNAANRFDLQLRGERSPCWFCLDLKRGSAKRELDLDWHLVAVAWYYKQTLSMRNGDLWGWQGWDSNSSLQWTFRRSSLYASRWTKKAWSKAGDLLFYFCPRPTVILSPPLDFQTFCWLLSKTLKYLSYITHPFSWLQTADCGVLTGINDPIGQ